MDLQDLKNRIEKLENIVLSFNYQDSATFDKKVVAKGQIIAKHGILITGGLIFNSPNNATTGIFGGSAVSEADIIAQIGVVGDGSIYISSAVAQPVQIKKAGTWTVLNIP